MGKSSAASDVYKKQHVAWSQGAPAAEQAEASLNKGLVLPPGGEAQAEINACAQCLSLSLIHTPEPTRPY